MRKKLLAGIAGIAVTLSCAYFVLWETPTEDKPVKTEEVVAMECEEKETESVAVDSAEAEVTKSSHKTENAKVNTEVTKSSVEEKTTGKETQEETQVSHTHNWVKVYGERQVERTRQVAWTKCYACGADMTGNISHIDKHLLNHETNVHYGTEYRTEVYYETETYVAGYKCSCGKTK